MGVFFKDQKKGPIYINRGKIKEHHQTYFYQSHTSTWIKQQQRTNELLQQSIQTMQKQSLLQEKEQGVRWEQITSMMKEFMEDQEQEQMMNQLLDRISQIQRNQKELQESWKENKYFERQLQDNMNHLSKDFQQMKQQLESYMEFQQRLTDQISRQEKQQEETAKRIEEQEAITQKIVRQLEFIRSIIFERTSYVSEKLEEYFRYVKQAVSPSELSTKQILFQENMEKERAN